MIMALESRKSVVDGKDSLDGASIASFYASLVGLSNRAGDKKPGDGSARGPGNTEAQEGVRERSRKESLEGLLSSQFEKPEKFTKAGGLLSKRVDSHREASTSYMDNCTNIQLEWRGASQAVDGACPRPGMTKGVQTKNLDYADFSKERRSFTGGSSGQNVDRGGQKVGLTGALGAQDKHAPAYRMKIPEENIGYKMLKKAGWNEKTGLGASGQGPLEPLKAHMKGDKRGIGADKQAKQVPGGSSAKKRKDVPDSGTSADRGKRQLTRAEMKQKKEREKEKEEAIAKYIYRAFAPDNV